MKYDGIAAGSILTKEHCDRIRDHLRRAGWHEFVICETLANIEDEAAIDPEGGTYLLELHLEGARRASH